MTLQLAEVVRRNKTQLMALDLKLFETPLLASVFGSTTKSERKHNLAQARYEIRRNSECNGFVFSTLVVSITKGSVGRSYESNDDAEAGVRGHTAAIERSKYKYAISWEELIQYTSRTIELLAASKQNTKALRGIAAKATNIINTVSPRKVIKPVTFSYSPEYCSSPPPPAIDPIYLILLSFYKTRIHKLVFTQVDDGVPRFQVVVDLVPHGSTVSMGTRISS